MKLQLTPPLPARDEVLVVDRQGVPVPFRWIDYDTLEVSDDFPEAAIQITPKHRREVEGGSVVED